MENCINDILNEYCGYNEPPRVIREEVIYLFKADLNKNPKTYNFDDVNLHSFRSSSITREEINRGSLIIYICYENYPRHKILKSRLF